MKSLTFLLFALLASGAAQAHSNFISNPDLPYPPGCALIPVTGAHGESPGQSVAFFDGHISLPDKRTGDWIPLQLKAWRSPCTETNRSLVWLEFVLPAATASRWVEFLVPSINVDAKGWPSHMKLVTEPNGWGSGGEVDRHRTFMTSKQVSLEFGEYFPATGDRRWVFLLDNDVKDSIYSSSGGLTSEEYNSAFSLSLRYPTDSHALNSLTIDVPATKDLPALAMPRIPLSGRLSGPWVIEGAQDQGFVVAISSQVGARNPEDGSIAQVPPLIFISHYTFDAQGRMLWLTGVAAFERGASEVDIRMEKVTRGRFRGSAPAQREIIGSVRLTANSCNDMRFEYDYEGLDLGAGSKRLQRIFSLETAGHDCRDYQARVDANQ